MLTHHTGMPTNTVTFHDRFNYILDQNNPTPGKKNSFSFVVIPLCVIDRFYHT